MGEPLRCKRGGLFKGEPQGKRRGRGCHLGTEEDADGEPRGAGGGLTGAGKGSIKFQEKDSFKIQNW